MLIRLKQDTFIITKKRAIEEKPFLEYNKYILKKERKLLAPLERIN